MAPSGTLSNRNNPPQMGPGRGGGKKRPTITSGLRWSSRRSPVNGTASSVNSACIAAHALRIGFALPLASEMTLFTSLIQTRGLFPSFPDMPAAMSQVGHSLARGGLKT